MRQIVGGAAAALVLGLAGPTLADVPLALILDVEGDVTPAVEAFEEVPEGAVLTLAPGARITMSHYRSCEEVTIDRGTVRVDAAGLSLSEPGAEDRALAPCAKVVQLAEADLANAAVVMRSLTIEKVVGLSPDIVLAGPLGRKFDRMRIVSGRTLVAVLDVSTPRVRLGETGVSLIDGAGYALFLTGPDVRQYAVSVTARAGAAEMLVLAP